MIHFEKIKMKNVVLIAIWQGWLEQKGIIKRWPPCNSRCVIRPKRKSKRNLQKNYGKSKNFREIGQITALCRQKVWKYKNFSDTLHFM